MERRRERRIKRRLTCEILTADGRRYRGLVRDVSPSGLFVQTQNAPPGGKPVDVVLRVGSEPPIQLTAFVRRQRRVPSRLAPVAAGGIGLRIRSAPAAYYDLLQRFTGLQQDDESAKDESAEEADEASSFRVRIRQVGGPRSRTLVIRGASAEEAAERARREAGPGWDVLGAEAI